MPTSPPPPTQPLHPLLIVLVLTSLLLSTLLTALLALLHIHPRSWPLSCTGAWLPSHFRFNFDLFWRARQRTGTHTEGWNRGAYETLSRGEGTGEGARLPLPPSPPPPPNAKPDTAQPPPFSVPQYRGDAGMAVSSGVEILRWDKDGAEEEPGWEREQGCVSASSSWTGGGRADAVCGFDFESGCGSGSEVEEPEQSPHNPFLSPPVRAGPAAQRESGGRRTRRRRRTRTQTEREWVEARGEFFASGNRHHDGEVDAHTDVGPNLFPELDWGDADGEEGLLLHRAVSPGWKARRKAGEEGWILRVLRRVDGVVDSFVWRVVRWAGEGDGNGEGMVLPAARGVGDE